MFRELDRPKLGAQEGESRDGRVGFRGTTPITENQMNGKNGEHEVETGMYMDIWIVGSPGNG